MMQNYLDKIAAIYHDRRSEIMPTESSMIDRIATYASLLDVKIDSGTLSAPEQAVFDSLKADLVWIRALQSTRDQAITDINAAADDSAAQAVINSVVWPIR